MSGLRVLCCLAASMTAASCGGDGHEAAAGLNPPGAEWDEIFYNPMPGDGDVVIEGPCGSRFIFRAVPTPTEANWLADVNVALGQAEDATPDARRDLSEQMRQAAVVGPFAADDNPAQRFYLLGKYEVTVNQYEAVMGAGCAAPTEDKNIPKDFVSRFDTEQFARRLSEYGFAHSEAKARLPRAGTSIAHVRLPTEAEWEFAARGGSQVSVEDRLAPTYPMDAEPSQFEWYSGDESCRGSLQPVGYLRPNPLGLHDMLGNVSEIVSDPFRLNRGGRLHGQPGGVTARGGSCSTPVENLRSAFRQEFPEFDSERGVASRNEFVGFRLALGAPAIPSNERLGQMEEDWRDLSSPRTQTPRDGNPAAALRALASRQDDVALAQAIAREASAFDAELARRSEIEARSARSAVANGALLIRSYRFVSRQIRSEEAGIARLPPNMTDVIEPAKARLANARRDAQLTRDLYTQLLVGAAEDFPESVMTDAGRQVSADLRNRYEATQTSLPVADLACMFVAQVSDYARRRPSEMDDYLNRIVDAEPADFARQCRQ